MFESVLNVSPWVAYYSILAIAVYLVWASKDE